MKAGTAVAAHVKHSVPVCGSGSGNLSAASSILFFLFPLPFRGIIRTEPGRRGKLKRGKSSCHTPQVLRAQFFGPNDGLGTHTKGWMGTELGWATLQDKAS